MKDLGEAYENSIRGYISAKEPEVAFYSTVTGGILSDSDPLNATY